MKYIPPLGSPNPDAPWVNAVPSTGAQGSIIDANVFNAVENEVVNAILGAGLSPSPNNYSQLLQAIQAIAGVLPGQITQAMLAVGAAPLPHIAVQPADNLNLSNDSATPNTVVDIAVGRVRDDSDVTNLQLAAAMAKSLSSSWVAGGVPGTPAAGCDTSSIGASQTWHAYLIGRLGQSITSYTRASNVATLAVANHGLGVGGTVRATGTFVVDGLYPITAVTTNTISFNNTGANVATTPCGGIVDGFDCLFSQSYPSPALPSGWTTKQCLGSVLSNSSSQIVAFFQYGDEFWYGAPPADKTAAAITASIAQLATLSVPNGVKVMAILNIDMTTSGVANAAALYIAPPDATITTFANWSIAGGFGSASTATVGGSARVWTNTGKQVNVLSDFTGTYAISTLGYRDPRRSLF